MQQYLNLLQDIIDNGVEKESGRANMPNTIGLSSGNIRMDLGEGFPLLTTKKMFWKGIIHELLWFIRGETNIKYLVDNGVHIWDSDAYRWYLKKYQEFINLEDRPQKKSPHKFESIEEFITAIKEGKTYKFYSKKIGNYKLGDLGKIYGYQWRNQNGVDQIKEVLDGLKNNPYSRYHIIDGWNKADFNDMALPPCHLLYQFIVRPLTLEERTNLWMEKYFISGVMTKSIKSFDDDKIPKFYLDLNMYQRSCDTFLGVPFNIASMSLLLMLFAKVSNMVPGISNWIGGDTHLYLNHIPRAEEQISRKPYNLPKMKINKDINSLEDIEKLSIDDFELLDYESHDKIKAELFTGVKK